MKLPRLTLRRWLLGVFFSTLACGLTLKTLGVAFHVGRPPALRMTIYPLMTMVHETDGSAAFPTATLPPRRMRRVLFGTLVNWADGTTTIYIHR